MKNRDYNSYQMNELLKAAESYGMTAEHLQVWQPAADDKHGEFSKYHLHAVMRLLRKKNFSALNAMMEVSGLSLLEAWKLKYLHALGINGKFIREHHAEYSFGSNSFIKAMKYLMQDCRLAREDALQQLKNLHDLELGILAFFYKDGLRREHILAARHGEWHDEYSIAKLNNRVMRHLKRLYQFIATFDDTYPGFSWERQSYLISVIRAEIKAGSAWEVALHHASDEAHRIRHNYPWGKSQRIHFLKRHVSQGVRAADVPENFDDDRRAMYNVLRIIHRLSVREALREMEGLSDEQIKVMRKHYKDGVNRRILLSYPHSSQLTEQMIAHLHMKPLDTILQMSYLTEAQGLYLGEFAASGLTMKEAGSLPDQEKISKLKSDVAVALIASGVAPFYALQSVLAKSDQDALAMLKESSEPQFIMSIRL